MARYKLKRKTFGVLDAAQNAAGGITEGAGKMLDSGLGKMTGAAVGAGMFGTGLASAAGSVLSSLTPLGALGGAILGWQGAKYAGKALKSAGQELKS